MGRSGLSIIWFLNRTYSLFRKSIIRNNYKRKNIINVNDERENMEELTTAESMVMKTIWDHPHEMALQEIMKLTNETYGKDWKSQTVSTYIAKLVKKGFLRMNQSGRNATYEIIIPELSYQQEQSRKFVKFWNRGSVAQFLTAFYKDHKLTKEEIEELRKSIDELDQ